MIREILKMGDPRLLEVARPVEAFNTPELHALVADMFETMHHANGAGLAAPQIGVGLQVIIFGFGSSERYPEAPPVPETVLVNPSIEYLPPDLEEGWEGCLSVPGLRGVVSRYRRVRYSGFDQYGAKLERIAEGFHARVVQHEYDHLIGKLYPMRITDFRSSASPTCCSRGSTRKRTTDAARRRGAAPRERVRRARATVGRPRSQWGVGVFSFDSRCRKPRRRGARLLRRPARSRGPGTAAAVLRTIRPARDSATRLAAARPASRGPSARASGRSPRGRRVRTSGESGASCLRAARSAVARRSAN